MRPSAKASTSFRSSPRPSATASTNCPYTSSRSRWRIFLSSGVIWRAKLPTSLKAPDLMTTYSTPTFLRRPWTLAICMTTPIDPVRVHGLAAVEDDPFDLDDGDLGPARGQPIFAHGGHEHPDRAHEEHEDAQGQPERGQGDPGARGHGRVTTAVLFLFVFEIVSPAALPPLAPPPALGLGRLLRDGGGHVLEAQPDAPLIGVDADDQEGELVADVDEVRRRGDGPVRHLRDVQEAVHAGLELHEGAEVREVAHLALHALAGLVALVDGRPRIGLHLLHAEGDPLGR